MIYDRFSIYIDTGSGFESYFPVNDTFSISWRKDEKWKFYRRFFEEKLLFCKDDYKKLLALEQSCDRCDRVPFRVDITCKGQTSTYFDGYLNLNKGDWDQDRCELEIKPETQDEYTCLLDNWKVEKNILFGTTKSTVNPFFGIIECQIVNAGPVLSPFPISSLPVASPPSISEGWTVVNNLLIGVTLVGTNPDLFEVQTNVQTTYCREFVAGATLPPGSGWVSVTGGWARALNAQFDFNASDLDYSDNVFEQIFVVAGYNIQTNEVYEYDNGVKLTDVVSLLVEECDYDIVSNLFNINPDNTEPSNDAYNCAAECLECLVLYQKTDITNADAFQNATIANLSLEKLFDILLVFNICFEIEGSILRIEHDSYFEAQQGIEIPADCLEATNKYSYVSDKLPQFEKFSWMDNASAYFRGSDIEYLNCYEVGKVEEYEFDCVSTDVNYLIANPDEIDTEGFVLVSAIEFNGQLVLNNDNRCLSWTELHECYWRHGRPQWSGIMNDEETCFESAIRTKKQVVVEFPLCCEDLLEFTPEDLMLSGLGWGEIKTASYDAKTQFLTVNLLHEQKKCC